jgi:hypothetical protein
MLTLIIGWMTLVVIKVFSEGGADTDLHINWQFYIRRKKRS